MQLPLPDIDVAAAAGAVLGVEGVDVGLQLGEVVHAVVGDADGADFAAALGFEEGAPGTEAGGAAAVGGVDEISVWGEV